MKDRRLRVLLLAYACEPNKSSEQEVGWKWALHLSEYCDITVITRSNNRLTIEDQAQHDARVNRIQWIYRDLGTFWLTVKRSLKAHRLYYSVWQKSVERFLRSNNIRSEFDVIHHLTFASYRYKTAIAHLPGKKIWGPVGGAESTPWHLLPWNHFSTLVHEIVRNLMARRAPGLKDAQLFDKVLVSTRETELLFKKMGISTTLMPTIGLDQSAVPLKTPRHNRSREQAPHLRLLYVGNLQHLKGIHLAIKSLKFTQCPTTLSIVGKGEYESALRQAACEHGVADRVKFLGYVPNSELSALHESYDVFIFPSFHDSGGIALMEAMVAEMPSIVLRCGGPEILTSELCAQRVALGSENEIIQSLAAAADIYASDTNLRTEHGTHARQRVIDFYLWENKAKTMIQQYEELVASNATIPSKSP